MKNILKISITICMLVSNSLFVFAISNEDFESDVNTYTQLCSKPDNELTEQEKETCKRFVTYMSNKSESLKTELKEIEAKRSEIAKNLKEYTDKIKNYDLQISILRKEIEELNNKIQIKDEEIRIKQEEIKTKELEVEALRKKVKERMVSAQVGMRLNQYVDIIMGAKSFNDLLRRVNGIGDISSYDNEERKKLITLIEELNIAKAELETAKTELEDAKVEVVTKQNSLLVLKKEAEVVAQEYAKQEADLEAEGNRILSNIQEVKTTLSNMGDKITNIPNTSGFNRPIGGGRISAGTWYYPESFGGGVHLGADFSTGKGSPIYAAGNGVVVGRADGCGDGYRGSTCGEAEGGSRMGGNQIYLITKINGTLYAIKYLHMLIGTPIALYSVVDAGAVIGQVGTSGNSTGPHVHVEVFNLGTMDITDYVNSWNGDLSFGAGWGSGGIGSNCEQKGPPCRVRPESVF
ncbi:murein hydrolase activator EnvC family protein [Anaerorhabdus sp.]|uniref:murein hydrolase activator EnvC family protein n=1 Tax=Anaerorhabdus sp. TaxID=1872524 RepID=UPI002FC6BEBC